MEGQCKFKLTPPGSSDIYECSLLGEHDGPHQESGTVPPFIYEDDGEHDPSADEPGSRWMMAWWELKE